MKISIGRAVNNDVVIDNKTVSRHHAELNMSDGKIVINDLSSKSGTYIAVDDGLRRISYHEVRDTDTIFIGNERFVVRELIAAASNKDVVYERNPITGEIVKK